MLAKAKTLIGTLLFLNAFANTVNAQSMVVGTTPANFSVNAGAANYSIPIQAVPGRGGMQPDLSLNYSGGGNSVLGVGWSLGGLSSIHRCTANLEQDGFIASITFTDKDRYCLDGQRLIPVSGINGGVGTEYKTEIDGYSQVISYGGSANHPDYFIAKTKAGQVITFGGGNASLTFPQGTTAWSVKEINDTTGNNPINYLYSIDQNSQYLQQIDYTGGKLELIYEIRPDVSVSYFVGNLIKQQNRVASLQIYSDQQAQAIRSYIPSYETVGPINSSRILELKQCSVTECFNPISFDWFGLSEATFSETNIHTDIAGNGWASSSYTRYLQDFNGDGITDFGLSLNSEANMSVFLGQVDGSFSQTSIYTDIPGNGWHSSPYERYIQDLNGDGIVDFGLSLKSEANMSVFLGQGDGTFSQTSIYTDIPGNGWHSSPYERYIQDFNGDGITDFGLSLKSEANMSVFLGQGDGSFSQTRIYTDIPGNGWDSSAYDRYIQDFNGDGITDFGLSLKSEANMSVFLGQGDGSFSQTRIYTDIPGNGWHSSPYERYIQDFNGDGIADFGLSLKSEANMSVFLGQGDGTFSQTNIHTDIAGNGWHSTPYERYIQDFNGDGITDFGLSLKSEANISIFLGQGDGSFSQTSIYTDIPGNGWSSSAYERYFQDVNGDGTIDFVLSLYSEANASVFLGNHDIGLIKKITGTNGSVTELSYKSLTDSSVYTKGTGAQYPIVDLQYPQYVVSSVQSSNGVGGTSSINYQYEGLKHHVRGRGSYGYSKVTESYLDTGKTQETYFNQTAFPYVGLVDRVVEKYNSQVVNESDKTYSATQLASGVYQTNLDQSVDKSYELNGDLITTVTTSHSNIDSYGNIGTVTVATGGNGETFTKITDSLYSNDVNNWYLGRLTETTVTHQAPGQSDQQRRSQFTYDSGTGLLANQSVVSVVTGSPLSSTSYTYDAYGHKTQVKVSATNETDRTTTTTYNTEGKPTQTCNALNQCETYTYTPEGWVETTTGPNSITTTWEYDSFGRKTVETRADGTETTIARHFASSGNCDVLANHAYSCSISQTTGNQPTIVQYDSLGREVRKITTGFDGRLIYSDTEYNHLAQLTRASRNYFMGDQIYWANSEYDALGRVTQMDEPAPHGDRNIITTAYNGLTTTVTSGPEQRQKSTTTNAIGQVIKRTEEEGSYVDYTYTADGNLKTTTVAGDSATTITLSYDEFGRKVGMADPDMGSWIYSYNAFGELISQTDAKSQTTAMVYDVLGRLTSRTEVEGVSTWVYGDNSAPQGSIGKLLSESNAGITKTYEYDNLGRPIKTSSNITGESTFSSQVIYDSLGRVSQTKYPSSDNFYTENIYNINGFLEKVRGARSKSEYYDLSALTPLVAEATDLALEYTDKANELVTIGNYYQQRIDYYKNLLSQKHIDFQSGDIALLSQYKAYDYLSAGDDQTYYIRIPDINYTFYHAGISIPRIIPSTFHYQVTFTREQQTVTKITAEAFAAIEPSLLNTGKQIYALSDTRMTCACDGDNLPTSYASDVTYLIQQQQGDPGSDEYNQHLANHQALLSGDVALADFGNNLNRIIGTPNADDLEGDEGNDLFFSGGVASGAESIRGNGGSDRLIINEDDAFAANIAGDGVGHYRIRDFMIDDITKNPDADVLQIHHFLDTNDTLDATNIGDYIHIVSPSFSQKHGFMFINREGDFTTADRTALDADVYAGGHGADLFLEFIGNYGSSARNNNFAAITNHPNNSVAQFQALMDLGFLNLSDTKITPAVIADNGVSATSAATFNDDKVRIFGTVNKDDLEGSVADDLFYSGGVAQGAESIRGNGGSDRLIFSASDNFLADVANDFYTHYRIRDFVVDNVVTNTEADGIQIRDFLDTDATLDASTIGDYIHIVTPNFGHRHGFMFINREGDFTAADRAALDADVYAGGHGADLFLEFIGGYGYLGDHRDNNFASVTGFANNTVEQFQALIDLGFLDITTNNELAATFNDDWVRIFGTANKDDLEGSVADDLFFSGGVASGAESIRGNGGSDRLIFESNDNFLANVANDFYTHYRIRDFVIDNLQTNSEADALQLRNFLDTDATLDASTIGDYIHIVTPNFSQRHGFMFVNREGDFTAADRAALDADVYAGGHGADLFLEFIGGYGYQGDHRDNSFASVTGFANNTVEQFQALIDLGFLDLTTRNTLMQTEALPEPPAPEAQPHKYLAHLNNTIIELETVVNLIDIQVQDYEETLEQLVVLAEQTLAAADNSFQYERTLNRGATTYTELVNDNDYTNYWQAIDVDASGRISAEVYGNGVVNDYTYNQATGQLQQIHSSLLVVDPIRHLEYQYDAYQNVTSREDHANHIRETYEYDRLDRLTRTDVSSTTYVSAEFNGSQTQNYDALGNITYKSDVGHYNYGDNGTGPHAVTNAGGNAYTYDANGNMLSGDSRTITWSSFNKPTLINKGANSASFAYGPDRARYKKENHVGHKTLYVGKLYEHVTKGSHVEEKNYIYANGQLVSEHIVSTQHGVQTRYLHKDALGSVDLVTDAHANVVDRRSFDAWGKLRNLTWQDQAGINDPLYITQLPFTNKGFTGHENIQEVGLIHMNGRVYDATLARFMSADPHIQEGSLTQNYNRYSYVMNNPLKYVDPSGYFFKSFFKKIFRAIKRHVKRVVKVVKKVVKAVKPFVGTIVALAVGLYCQVCGGKLLTAFWAGAAGGAAGAAVNGGNILKGALTGGLTGLASSYIGGNSFFGKVGKKGLDWGRALAHGVVGGTMSVIQGGKFGAGFISSAFTKLVSNPIQGLAIKISDATGIASEVIGTFGAALVGGTASVLGGGKFSNGATTAAAQYLFNQIPSSKKWYHKLGENIRGKGVRNEIEKHKLLIDQAALDNGVDGNLIRAIIYEEMTHQLPFESTAELLGFGDTVGLGQITEGYFGLNREQLFDPKIGINAIARHLHNISTQPLIDPDHPVQSIATKYNCGSCSSIRDYGRRVQRYMGSF